MLGIKTFSNDVSYMKLLDDMNITALISILAPITIIYFLITGIKNKSKKENLILGIFGLAQFIMVYPIADEIHFQIAALPTVIGMLYLICKKIQEIKPIKVSIFIEHFMNVITISMVFMVVLFFTN